jgi:hypothetical protein
VKFDWYRSRVFWFGLPGLVLLMFMWFGYPRSFHEAQWDTHHVRRSVGFGEGAVGFYVHTNSHWRGIEDISRGPGFHLDGYEVESGEEAPLFGPAFHSGSRVDSFRGYTTVEFSLWFIVLLYLVLWLGTLVWWQRRRYRSIE